MAENVLLIVSLLLVTTLALLATLVGWMLFSGGEEEDTPRKPVGIYQNSVICDDGTGWHYDGKATGWRGDETPIPGTKAHGAQGNGVES